MLVIISDFYCCVISLQSQLRANEGFENKLVHFQKRPAAVSEYSVMSLSLSQIRAKKGFENMVVHFPDLLERRINKTMNCDPLSSLQFNYGQSTSLCVSVFAKWSQVNDFEAEKYR